MTTGSKPSLPPASDPQDVARPPDRGRAANWTYPSRARNCPDAPLTRRAPQDNFKHRACTVHPEGSTVDPGRSAARESRIHCFGPCLLAGARPASIREAAWQLFRPFDMWPIGAAHCAIIPGSSDARRIERRWCGSPRHDDDALRVRAPLNRDSAPGKPLRHQHHVGSVAYAAIGARNKPARAAVN